ncbi:hypothetical protein [Marinobacter sp. 2_MG-2023]|uniref:hypothetical protein n=1 Tax=Marinobacter sp. 2_MG-2023 TaxID=3062679 RepID=UPI0026E3DBC2|nr:hypothetical protein [Marinobacter sp. 2_MG-2023]MDO6443454.1 hypothetical protein [Marinobacter sp. 2_MG-2023]
MKKYMFWIISAWFIVVNAGQFIPSLNTLEPYVLGIPFNLAWIWGWNFLITLYLIFFAIFGSKSHDVDEFVAMEYAEGNGIRGLI